MAYPFKTYNFRVTIDGIASPAGDPSQGIGGGFSEVQGFDIACALIEYRDGNSPLNTTIKVPGLTSYSNVTLKWGATEDLQFYNWVIETTRVGRALVTHNVTIELLDDDGQTVVATWQLTGAWPCKYSASGLSATGNEFQFESLELCHHGLERVA
ncbi:phage tail protein [Clostridia bacterium]|nr:phage tail protein [Clostridia bacterium]